MIDTTEKQITDEQFWIELSNYELKRKSNGKKILSSPENDIMTQLLSGIKVDNPEVNEIYTAKYLGVLKDQHVLSVNGFKDNIYIENRPLENKYLKNTEIGDEIDVIISEIDEDVYFIKGSISGIYESRAHETLKSLDDDLVVVAKINSINPAGYDVDIYHEGVTLPGFMPNTLAGINKLYDPESIVGEELNVMIESYSEQEGTYIVSRRKYLKTLIPAAMEELETGKVYEGNVTGTTQFGVFVEFNECLTGMVHKANINEEWQDRISEIEPGMIIQFYIKEVVKDKIILTQILRDSLWDSIRVGQVIQGKVKDNKPFGTLVLLDDETMGLIHISEIEKIGKKLTPEQDVKVKVLAVDRTSRKIFLTVA